MRATQEKIKALKTLQRIVAEIKDIQVKSRNWDDVNSEGLTGFLMNDAGQQIAERMESFNIALNNQ